MSDYIIDIVIILVFLYEGIIMLTKKNGGNNRYIEKYTEESLAKYSIAAGIAFIVFALYEVFILLNKLNILNVLSSIEDSTVRMLITVVPIGVMIILLLVFHFTILKKADGYDDSSDRRSKGNDDEEY